MARRQGRLATIIALLALTVPHACAAANDDPADVSAAAVHASIVNAAPQDSDALKDSAELQDSYAAEDRDVPPVPSDGPAFAPSTSGLFQQHPELQGNSLDLSRLAWRLASTTAIVLVGIVATLLALRRHVLRRARGGTGVQTMSIESTLPLAHRSSLHVVKLDEHRLVVGCDAGGLRTVLLLPETFAQAMSHADVPDGHERSPDVSSDDHDSTSFSRPHDWELTHWKPQRPIM